nr:odorant binding protein 3 [Pachyrhinus yasumatsui]
MTRGFYGFLFVSALFSAVIFENVLSRMTDKQLVAAVKLVRNMCLGKAKTTLDEVDKMHQGNWEVDHNAQCYMWCSLNMYKLIDEKNQFDRNAADMQLKQLPEHMHDYVIKCMNMCDHAATNLNDKCVAAWEYAKCMYFCEPEMLSGITREHNIFVRTK